MMPFFMYNDEIKMTDQIRDKLMYVPQYDIVSWAMDNRFTIGSVLVMIAFALIFNTIAAIKFKKLEV